MSEVLSLREVQECSLEILKKIDAICREQGLTYYIFYGSLIGAIRHKGFIPWDDDLDIAMPRDDYEKLLVYFDENKEALLPLKLFDWKRVKDYPYDLARISDTSYRMIPENEKECGMGTFIDIYVIDGMGNDYKAAVKNKRKTARLSSLGFLATRKRYARDNTKSTLKMIIKVPAFIGAKIIGKRWIFSKIDSLSDIYPFESSKYVANTAWSTGVEVSIFKKEWFDHTIDVPFEDAVFKAPSGYDELLRQLYGDYMQLPPEEDRTQQHFYSIVKREN